MNTPLKRYMVFTDFTRAAAVAAGHCFQLAARDKAEVISLHVVSNADDLEWAKAKSREEIQKIDNFDASIPYEAIASEQNLFQGMNKFLREQGVALGFMPTHGKKDLQFVTGSNALKLIYNAELPTVVVQQHTPVRPYAHIMIPVLSHYAAIQLPSELLKEIIHLFQARVTLLLPASKSASEAAAVELAATRLDELLAAPAGKLERLYGPEGEKKFHKAVAAMAQTLDTSLIAVLLNTKHHRDEAEKNKKFFQALITNEQGIPVLCL
jgi:hypothetical protein